MVSRQAKDHGVALICIESYREGTRMINLKGGVPEGSSGFALAIGHGGFKKSS